MLDDYITLVSGGIECGQNEEMRRKQNQFYIPLPGQIKIEYSKEAIGNWQPGKRANYTKELSPIKQ